MINETDGKRNTMSERHNELEKLDGSEEASIDRPSTLGELLGKWSSMVPFRTGIRPSLSSAAKGGGQFNPEVFAAMSREHIDVFKVAEYGRTRREEGAGQQTRVEAPLIVQNVATFENVVFFRNPEVPEQIFSARNEHAKRMALVNGHVVATVNHYMGPTAPDGPNNGSNGGIVDTYVHGEMETKEVPGDHKIVVPDCSKGMPSMWKFSAEESMASAVVRAVSERVIIEGDPTVYSPYRLYGKEERAAAKMPGAGSSRLTKYFQIYYFATIMHGDKDGGTFFKDWTMNAMTTEATKHWRENNASPPAWLQITRETHSIPNV